MNKLPDYNDTQMRLARFENKVLMWTCTGWAVTFAIMSAVAIFLVLRKIVEAVL